VSFIREIEILDYCFVCYLGKTMAWRVLLMVLNRLENSDGQAHVIDPKAISKDDLYGSLDQNTRNIFSNR
jgi:hypothetical protein